MTNHVRFFVSHWL